MSSHNSMNNHNKVRNQQCCNKFQEVVILCKICFSRCTVCTVSKTRRKLLLLNYLQILWFLSSIFLCLVSIPCWLRPEGPLTRNTIKVAGIPRSNGFLPLWQIPEQKTCSRSESRPSTAETGPAAAWGSGGKTAVFRLLAFHHNWVPSQTTASEYMRM